LGDAQPRGELPTAIELLRNEHPPLAEPAGIGAKEVMKMDGPGGKIAHAEWPPEHIRRANPRDARRRSRAHRDQAPVRIEFVV
jgi:hypothetical protein